MVLTPRVAQNRRHRHTVSQPAAHQIRDTPVRDKKRDGPRQRELQKRFWNDSNLDIPESLETRQQLARWASRPMTRVVDALLLLGRPHPPPVTTMCHSRRGAVMSARHGLVPCRCRE
jgi:hypothetical protein